ncbi:hypothetical protein [Clostridium gasigenes]
MLADGNTYANTCNPKEVWKSMKIDIMVLKSLYLSYFIVIRL